MASKFTDDNSKIYDGLIVIKSYGEDDDALFLTDSENIEDVSTPLISILEEDKSDSTHLTVRFWISDTRLTQERLVENTVFQAMGIGDVEYFQHYSEITGYLWTSEDFHVGGHDLEAEIRSSAGKWLYMEIVYHSVRQAETD